jgi:hypothetical protein
MSTTVCRDCGYDLTADLRGCPRCALNIEFERKLDRLVWGVLAPTVVLLLLIAITLIGVMTVPYLIR